MRNGAVLQRVGLFSASLPGWGRQRVIEAAVSLGFPAVEWATGPGNAIEHPELGPEVRHLCEQAGLAIGGLSVQDTEITLTTPQRARRYIDLAVALGAPHVRLFAPPYRGGSLEREQRRARAGLESLVDVAGPAGIAILVETSPGTLAAGPDMAAALVERQTPEVAGVLYDPGNMAIEGHLEPALAIARLGRYLHHVHVKNIAWICQGGEWRWRHTQLAKGMLDWQVILGALAAARYHGRFSIDHLGGKYTPALLATESSALRELVMAAYGSADSDGRAVSGDPADAAGQDGSSQGGSRSSLIA
jgi:sugar phosphate isomerase/epimerase